LPTTSGRGYSVQTAGSNSGVWGAGNTGVDLNTGVISIIDSNLAGATTLSLASTTPIALSGTQVQTGMLIFTGALLANIAVTTTMLGAFWVENRTTGNFYVSLSNGTGNAMLVPQGSAREVWSDSTYGIRALNLPPVGSFLDLGSSAAHPSLIATTSPTVLNGEYVLCYGQSLATASYPALSAVLGTTWGSPGGGNFTVPDFRGTARFGKDNMGGATRGLITTAGSSIDGTTVGTEGGAQNVVLVKANMPLYNLTVTDPGHTHTVAITNGATNVTNTGSNATPGSFGSLTSGSSVTGISVSSGGSGTATVVMPPTGIVNVLIKV